MSAPDGIEVRRKRQPLHARVPHLLARDGSIPDKEFRLWVVLESHADWTDRDARLTIGRLAEECGCSAPTIQRAQNGLVERGLLEIESGKTVGRSNIYTVVEPPWGSITGDSPPSRTHARPPQSPTREGVDHPRATEQESLEQETNNNPAAPTETERLCALMADLIEQHRGRRPKVTAAWESDMDRLVRLGPTNWAEPGPIRAGAVATVIRGVFCQLNTHSAGGFCWADQIQSPGNLRKQWDTLVLQLKAKASPAPRRNRGGDERDLTELLQDAAANERTK